MGNLEGVIKYQLNHQNTLIDKEISIAELTAWRTLLFDLKLIGQIEERYEGLGFGNISQRIESNISNTDSFLITGSQTGGIRVLNRQLYCTVLKAHPHLNTIDSEGKTKPSSESLTHASVYQQDKNIQAVIHIHCPEIWTNTTQLNLPYTASKIKYGTTEMATEVARLLNTADLKNKKIFSMLGHKDGIIAFSDSLESAAQIIIGYYAKSLTLDQN
mgnify:CR=1 FL=1